MDELTTDDQRAEQIKKWWQENGRAIVTGALLGIGILLGWQMWQRHIQLQASEASLELATVLTSIENSELDEALSFASHLREEFDSTLQSDLAGLIAARVHMERGERSAAADILSQVSESARRPEVAQLARLRLARVLIDLGSLDRAESLLDTGPWAQAYAAHVEELRGDIALKQEDRDGALAAYLRAQAFAGPELSDPLLDYKIADLGSEEAPVEGGVESEESDAPSGELAEQSDSDAVNQESESGADESGDEPVANATEQNEESGVEGTTELTAPQPATSSGDQPEIATDQLSEGGSDASTSDSAASDQPSQSMPSGAGGFTSEPTLEEALGMDLWGDGSLTGMDGELGGPGLLDLPADE